MSTAIVMIKFYQLLSTKRFLPYFCTQFFGAFNDNVFKNALIITIVFSPHLNEETVTNFLINLCAFLFILPFLIFSGYAGQLADKFEKAILIRMIKFIEICLAVGVSVAYYLHSIELLIALLFLLGTQSAFFGPIKYSILPQHLSHEELLPGNSLVEMGTFIAILTGTILGGVYMSVPHLGAQAVSYTLIITACLGFIVSFCIPTATPNMPHLHLTWHPIKANLLLLKQIYKQMPSVFIIMSAISWFWFVGATFLSQHANFVKYYLGGNQAIATMVLSSLSIGIAIGSLWCSTLSRNRLNPAFVPLAAICITLATIDISFASSWRTTINITPQQFLKHPMGLRVIFDLFILGFFSGIYLVPLYTLLQIRSNPNYRSRIVAANNISNAFLMTCAAAFAVGLFSIGLTIPNLFFVTALVNLLVCLLLLKFMPEFQLHLYFWWINYTQAHVQANFTKQYSPNEPAIFYSDTDNLSACLQIMKLHNLPIVLLHFDKPDNFWVNWLKQKALLFNAYETETLEIIQDKIQLGCSLLVILPKKQNPNVRNFLNTVSTLSQAQQYVNYNTEIIVTNSSSSNWLRRKTLHITLNMHT